MKTLLSRARLFGLALIGLAGLSLAVSVQAGHGGHGGGGHGGGGHGGGGHPSGGHPGGGHPAVHPSVPGGSGHPATGRGTMPSATPTSRAPAASTPPMHSVPLKGNYNSAKGSSSVQLSSRGRQGGATVSASGKSQTQLSNRGQSGSGALGAKGAGQAKTSAQNYLQTHGTKFSGGHLYKGRHHNHWSYRNWDRDYRCWLCWDPCVCCYYYWCAPDACYYPIGYCPYNTFCWNVADGGDEPPSGEVEGQAEQPAETEPATTDEEPVYGLKIIDLDAQGSAAREGLQVGDVILSINGQPTPSYDQLRPAVERGGPRADVVFLNKDNGQVERMILRPVAGRIGVTIDEVRVR